MEVRDDVDANKLQAYLGEMGVREFLASFVEIALKDQVDVAPATTTTTTTTTSTTTSTSTTTGVHLHHPLHPRSPTIW